MIPRYSSDDVTEIFSDSTRLRIWHSLETAHLRSLEIKEIAPSGTAAEVSEALLTVERHAVEENRLRHDVAAMVSILESESPVFGRFVHFGLTSSDIVDTTWAIQIRHANFLLREEIVSLLQHCTQLIHSTRDVPFIARTHTQSAQVNSFGSFLSSMVFPIYRAANSMMCMTYYGKMSGAIGKNVHLDPSIETETLHQFNLEPSPFPTQIIDRLHFLDWMTPARDAVVAINRLATQLRLLAHQEVGEVAEGFAPGQVGSSAMPQKKNPVTLEKICGLSRMVVNCYRSMEDNVISWHDRDISHSSVERVVIPDIFHLAFDIVRNMKSVLTSLVVDRERMQKNIDKTLNTHRAEALLLASIRAGSDRLASHRKIATLCDSARESGVPLNDKDAHAARTLETFPVFSYKSKLTYIDMDLKFIRPSRYAFP